VRREDVVGAPAQEVERFAEQLADLRTEHRVDVGERSDPAAEPEAAGGVFFAPARGLLTPSIETIAPTTSLLMVLLFCLQDERVSPLPTSASSTS